MMLETLSSLTFLQKLTKLQKFNSTRMPPFLQVGQVDVSCNWLTNLKKCLYRLYIQKLRDFRSPEENKTFLVRKNLLIVQISSQDLLRKKCPYSELSWSVFSRIRNEYGQIIRISPYSVQIWENADQNNSRYGHFSRSHHTGIKG